MRAIIIRKWVDVKEDMRQQCNEVAKGCSKHCNTESNLENNCMDVFRTDLSKLLVYVWSC